MTIEKHRFHLTRAIGKSYAGLGVASNRNHPAFIGFRKVASVFQPGLFMVIERFPERRAAFKRLHAENEGFQSLCESYRQCSEALRYWSKSKQALSPDRNREYKKLLHELEMEILGYRPDDPPTESSV